MAPGRPRLVADGAAGIAAGDCDSSLPHACGDCCHVDGSCRSTTMAIAVYALTRCSVVPVNDHSPVRILCQMATSGGGSGGGLGQQQGGGFGQFFRGDLPKKLGTLLVRVSGNEFCGTGIEMICTPFCLTAWRHILLLIDLRDARSTTGPRIPTLWCAAAGGVHAGGGSTSGCQAWTALKASANHPCLNALLSRCCAAAGGVHASGVLHPGAGRGRGPLCGQHACRRRRAAGHHRPAVWRIHFPLRRLLAG